MTLTNAYASLDQFKQQMRLKVDDVAEDARIELAISAASRQIDAHTGRRFWQDATVIAREFEADDEDELHPGDISTTTGLIVKVDYDLDGTYETTLTLGTHYRLWPLNADKCYPVEPYTAIKILPLSNAFFPEYDDMPTVQVTAKFGWPAVPDDVTKACLVQAGQLFKSDDAAFGVAQFAEAGVAYRLQSRLHPIAEALLERYCKARIG